MCKDKVLLGEKFMYICLHSQCTAIILETPVGVFFTCISDGVPMQYEFPYFVILLCHGCFTISVHFMTDDTMMVRNNFIVSSGRFI